MVKRNIPNFEEDTLEGGSFDEGDDDLLGEELSGD